MTAMVYVKCVNANENNRTIKLSICMRTLIMREENYVDEKIACHKQIQFKNPNNYIHSFNIQYSYY